MKITNLPSENAAKPGKISQDPKEQANLGVLAEKPPAKALRFAEDRGSPEKSSSQKSLSKYSEVLSQPSQSLSHRERLLWLQRRRAAGLHAQCDRCGRWRALPHVIDRHQLPHKWYCELNPDKTQASCSVPEAPLCLRAEEDLIHAEYTAGSIVWARLNGWPWWPAMVDDCVDTEQYYWLDGFSDIPTHYNVVFFDSEDATRAWMSPANLKPYFIGDRKPKIPNNKKIKSRLDTAVNQAIDASKLSLADRLQKYSFIARYKGQINSPKKLSKRDLLKQKKNLKRKFNMEFDWSDSEEDDMAPKSHNGSHIVAAAPKQPKTGHNAAKKPKEVLSALKNGDKQETETMELTSINDTFKEPDSLAAQKGSTVSTVGIESFDNDTSKTYVPENNTEESTQCTQNSTITSEVNVRCLRAGTPGSDDFEF